MYFCIFKMYTVVFCFMHCMGNVLNSYTPYKNIRSMIDYTFKYLFLNLTSWS